MSAIRTFFRRLAFAIRLVLGLETLTCEVFVEKGLDTPYFSAESDSQLRLKPGVVLLEDSDRNGNVVYMINNGSGGRLRCRCAKAYTGSCLAEVPLGGSIATCTGTCTHSEDGSPKACGWYWDQVTNLRFVFDLYVQ